MPAKKQITKDMILHAALQILKVQGYEAVNIKQLAAELGCSTQPVYLSFSGMDDLRRELIPMAAAEFEKYMKSAGKDGSVRLYDMSYIRFAREEPQLFCFLFMRANAFAEIRKILIPIIECSIKELMDRYSISHEQADYLHDQMWMHAHGIASMIATSFCNWDMTKVQALLEGCKDAFTAQYEA